MEFSCHIWGFDELLLPEALGTMARLGFRYVDLGTSPQLSHSRAGNPRTREAVIAEFQADLALFNLKVADLYLVLPRISVDDDKVRRNEVAYFRAMLPFAEALGVHGITVSPGLVHPPTDDEALTRTIISLQQMVKAARGVHIPLSIEPQPRSMIQTPQQALELLEIVDGLQLTLDWGYCHTQGYSLTDLKSLLPHTRHIFLRQATKEQLQTPFKNGSIKFGQIMQALHKADYQGVLGLKLLPQRDEKSINPVVEYAALRDSLRELRDAQAGA